MKLFIALLVVLFSSCGEKPLVRDREIELAYMTLVDSSPSDTTINTGENSREFYSYTGENEFRFSLSSGSDDLLTYSWNRLFLDAVKIRTMESVLFRTPDSNVSLVVRRYGSHISLTSVPSFRKFWSDYQLQHSGGN